MTIQNTYIEPKMFNNQTANDQSKDMNRHFSEE